MCSVQVLSVLCGKIFNNIPESLSQKLLAKTYLKMLIHIQRFSYLAGMVIERGSQLAGRVIYNIQVSCVLCGKTFKNIYENLFEEWAS